MNSAIAVIREAIFLSHAAPEDNEFALWLSAKLAIAGYRVWIDRRRLRGGDDFWDEIDRVLRTEAEDGTIVPTAAFDDHIDDFDEEAEPSVEEGEDAP
jgi:TIR domain